MRYLLLLLFIFFGGIQINAQTICLDTLSNRLVLIHTYKAIDFIADEVALWIPTKDEISRFSCSVSKKVSYTKVFKRVFLNNTCTVYFITLRVGDHSKINTIDDLFLKEVCYYGKAVFEQQSCGWVLTKFEKGLPELPELEQKIQVAFIDTITADQVLTKFFNATNIFDSSGIYHLNDYEIYQKGLSLLTDNQVEITFDEVHYYNENSKQYALIVTSFESYRCRACNRVTSLTKVEKQINGGWKLLVHERFWDGASSLGKLPFIYITELRMKGVNRNVILNPLDYGKWGHERNYNHYYSLDNFELILNYESYYHNSGDVFNNAMENLHKMDYDFKQVELKYGDDSYDFKLMYYDRNIYQYSEYYLYNGNHYQLLKKCACLEKGERNILCSKSLFLESIYVDTFYTLEYISNYGQIDLEILEFLNKEKPPTPENPSFKAPLYLHEHFYLLFDKNAVFDLDKLALQYNIPKHDIECVNDTYYYSTEEERKYFLLIPKKKTEENNGK